MADLKEIAKYIIEGDAEKVKELVQKAVNEGIDAKRILNEGLIAGMDVVGTRFKCGELYIPEVLLSAQAMQGGMDILEPLFVKEGVKAKGTIVIGTVKGDLHDIGKNLVAMMLKGGGWKVVDLGTDVDEEKFVQTAIEENADIIGMSALLTTTMINMKSVVDLARIKDCKAKIVVGGAPVTESYAEEIGADGYAPDAVTAVETLNKLMQT